MEAPIEAREDERVPDGDGESREKQLESGSCVLVPEGGNAEVNANSEGEVEAKAQDLLLALPEETAAPQEAEGQPSNTMKEQFEQVNSDLQVEEKKLSEAGATITKLELLAAQAVGLSASEEKLALLQQEHQTYLRNILEFKRLRAELNSEEKNRTPENRKIIRDMITARVTKQDATPAELLDFYSTYAQEKFLSAHRGKVALSKTKTERHFIDVTRQRMEELLREQRTLLAAALPSANESKSDHSQVPQSSDSPSKAAASSASSVPSEAEDSQGKKIEKTSDEQKTTITSEKATTFFESLKFSEEKLSKHDLLKRKNNAWWSIPEDAKALKSLKKMAEGNYSQEEKKDVRTALERKIQSIDTFSGLVEFYENYGKLKAITQHRNYLHAPGGYTETQTKMLNLLRDRATELDGSVAYQLNSDWDNHHDSETAFCITVPAEGAGETSKKFISKKEAEDRQKELVRLLESPIFSERHEGRKIKADTRLALEASAKRQTGLLETVRSQEVPAPIRGLGRIGIVS